MFNAFQDLEQSLACLHVGLDSSTSRSKPSFQAGQACMTPCVQRRPSKAQSERQILMLLADGPCHSEKRVCLPALCRGCRTHGQCSHRGQTTPRNESWILLILQSLAEHLHAAHADQDGPTHTLQHRRWLLCCCLPVCLDELLLPAHNRLVSRLHGRHIGRNGLPVPQSCR